MAATARGFRGALAELPQMLAAGCHVHWEANNRHRRSGAAGLLDCRSREREDRSMRHGPARELLLRVLRALGLGRRGRTTRPSVQVLAYHAIADLPAGSALR